MVHHRSRLELLRRLKLLHSLLQRPTRSPVSGSRRRNRRKRPVADYHHLSLIGIENLELAARSRSAAGDESLLRRQARLGGSLRRRTAALSGSHCRPATLRGHLRHHHHRDHFAGVCTCRLTVDFTPELELFGGPRVDRRRPRLLVLFSVLMSAK